LVFFIEGASPTGAYNNWQSGQPGDSGPSANHGMFLYSTNNAWYAVNDNDTNGYGYIVEYGAPGDSTALQPPGDFLDGGAGDDSIFSRGGNDSIDGGVGNDRLDLNLTMLSQDVILDLSDPTTPTFLSTGGSVVNVENFTVSSGRGNDSIRTGAGSDSLYGGAGSDYLYGESGADLINGGLNSDTLSGGDGSDIFSYQNPIEGGDVITDFNGEYDRIQVSAAGFGGGLVPGIDLLASGRYVENNTGLATSAAGIGQFIYLAGSNQLYWDGDGEGGMSASLMTTLPSADKWSASGLQVV
jgi:Ca2+-binding RTX toxin-like protein